ncbi:thioredoxin fold domain-containing protein [Vibrio parahaemolyticus]|uniref:thioredoxin fold domain-containing protein n=2 Tax=Vibrionaceae TaxID=641 RepID=UPI001A8FA0A7|nr:MULTISPECIES: thioredoxin fold domain-containing protein [Vibrio]EGQ7973543.1 thioredoxin fold domain-containing protein [Vibrio parahaemolyticus]MBO0208555.1 thioredoxin fold domain-containing protein [Vibrio sp. Vb0877]MCR9809152.1 thioredoxin fold domain-containing protein [Vibrio parahaemolyticus]MDW2323144.1 thioredoxin fold domain-containing protein [Vibrio sp. 1159]
MVSSRKLSTLLVAGSLLGGFSAQSMAAINSNTEQPAVTKSSLQAAPPQLKNLIDQGAIEVIDIFKHDSFTGWLVKTQGDYHLYWATKDNYVVAGPLIDENGINITSKYLDAKKPIPDYNKVFDKFEDEAWYFSTHPKGDSKGIMYVFIEPFCGWCSKLFNDIEPEIQNGLEVRWVPVSFLSAQSPDVIEYITSSANPYQALQEHEHIRSQRGRPNSKPATMMTRERIEKNGDFMKEFGIAGTPGIVYLQNGKAKVAGYMKPPQMHEFINMLKTQ